MRTAMLVLALLAAADGGKPLPPERRTVEVKNLGASAVKLLLQQADGSYVWGPFDLGPQETLRVAYCPCAALALELRSPVRRSALHYPLTDLTALLLSEDRWSQGEPIIRREGQAPKCDGPSSCEGPPFHIGR
jgi:hypothetical protein